MRMHVTRALSSSLSFVIVCMLATSCVSVNRFSDTTYAARDKDRKAFVQTRDGVITEADEVKLRSPLIGRSTIQLDGDVKIPVKEVLAYQNGTAYYRSIRGSLRRVSTKG